MEYSYQQSHQDNHDHYKIHDDDRLSQLHSKENQQVLIFSLQLRGDFE